MNIDGLHLNVIRRTERRRHTGQNQIMKPAWNKRDSAGGVSIRTFAISTVSRPNTRVVVACVLQEGGVAVGGPISSQKDE
jgi:hypothetical protein